ncbi:MAG: bifunctional oligoribonuclease/PAP phosphatase NrnA [Clostridia bacterium]|nr:bifunctional oligoribonuclease/PAP phosphatase NrnA [Clostridia bacterium]
MPIQKLRRIAEIIKQQKKITIVSHIIPDGDAIGSSLALGMALGKLGIRVQILNQDEVPKIYTFLPESSKIKTEFDFAPETIILLDCSDLGRIGSLRDLLPKQGLIINIDHHISNTNFGDFNYVDTGASATGEIIFELVELLNGSVDKDMATCLYTSILTDTGSFQYENTTAKTHLVASSLLSAGADLGLIRSSLWENVPLTSVRLLAKTLKTLAVDPRGEIAWVSIPFETYSKHVFDLEHIESIVNYPKSIEGVEIGICFREFAPGKVKVSLRSKTKVDVSLLAESFGGGGHKRAAGFVSEATLASVMDTVIKKAQSYFN